MNVVSFSGGKDSTAMLLMMLEKHMQVNRVIFVDLSKEFPAMYQHIERVQAVCPVEIEIIKVNFDYWFSEHVKAKGKRKGEKGYGWPDHHNRWCTALKRGAFMQAIKSCGLDVVEWHGIAYDERERCNANPNRRIRYPLVEWGITERNALDYCYSKGFNWNGLYEKFHRVSCWCCPLSRIGELRVLYKDYPELWQQLIEMDKKSSRKFRADYSVNELSERFARELGGERQSLLWGSR